MTRDQIHELVKRAVPASSFDDLWPWYADQLQALVAKAAAHEREAACRAAMNAIVNVPQSQRISADLMQHYVCSAIRARSNT